jgi:hypothetical protein
MSLTKRWMEEQGLFEADELQLEDDYEYDVWLACQYLNSSLEDYLNFSETASS